MEATPTALPVPSIESTMRIMRIDPEDQLPILDDVLNMADVILDELATERERKKAER